MSLFPSRLILTSADYLSVSSPHTEEPTGDRSIRTFRRRKMSLLVKWNTAQRRPGIGWARTLCALLLLAALGKGAFAQESAPPHAYVVTPLADLLQEAEKNNPQIQPARQPCQPAKHAPTQFSPIPDPHF